MTHFLNLLAAIALLVWGTYLVRTGVLRVFGGPLRRLLARSMGNRFTALLAGLVVTALVESSSATALMLSAFVGQGLVALPVALAAMLGADLGGPVIAIVLSLDLDAVAPLMLLIGVVLFFARPETTPGRVGRVLIGLGLMLLALRLIGTATTVLTSAPAVRDLLASLTSARLLEITLGAVLAVLSSSSLAIVLLAATLAASGAVPLLIALGLVLGASLGSGILAVLKTRNAAPEIRQVPLGHLAFKAIGVTAAAPFAGLWAQHAAPFIGTPANTVLLFYLGLNLAIGIVFLGLTRPVARAIMRFVPRPSKSERDAAGLPNHLDPSALTTPSLALACAARETLHMADQVETMLNGLLPVIRRNDLHLSQKLRKLDNVIDQLYSAIGHYLTQLSRESLDEAESRQWANTMAFAINMEQAGDITERMLADIENKKIKHGRIFNDAGVDEIADLHSRLLDNLRLATSVFLTNNLRDAQRLLEERARFRDLEHVYGNMHLTRLANRTLQSVETSSLRIELIGELKRINSHVCSIAYPILDAALGRDPGRFRLRELAEPSPD